MTTVREMRWAIVTLIGGLYCFFLPRLFYRGRK